MKKSKSTRGVSILEVLFAIMVTTIGLLGAIAVFPVASAQARRGKLNDAMSVAGISAVHQFDVQYMRQPRQWVYSDGTPVEDSTPAASSPPWSSPPRTVPVGTAFMIDTAFVNVNGGTAVDSTGQKDDASAFPYYQLTANTAVSSMPVSSAVRMQRITLRSSINQALGQMPTPMSQFQAETVFAIHDDLAYERPKDRSLNAIQLMTPSNSRRETEGMMTWAATVAPKVNYEVDSMGASGSVATSDSYILSILVFDRRDTSFPLQTELVVDTGANAVNAERLVDVASFPGSGVGGGEVVLQARPGRNAGDLDLRTNDWLMLSGYKEDTSGVTLKVGPIFLWYRVADTDPDIDTTSGTPQRYVTLQGPDWPLYNTSGTSYTQATIVSGVVAVYEKTIRLEY